MARGQNITMKKKAEILIFCLLMILCSQISARGEALDFTSALELLKKNNNALQAAHQEVEQTDFERKAARGLYLPKITVKGSYTRMDEALTYDLGSVREAIVGASNITATALSRSAATGAAVGAAVNSRLPSFEKEIQGEQFSRVTLDATWPVYTGGRILAANRAANEKLKAVKERSRMTESMLVTQLAQQYFALSLAVEAEAVRKDVRDGMEEHYKNAKKMEESGMIARVERLHAEVALADADREYKNAMRDRELAQTALANLLSSPDPVTTTSPLFMHTRLEPMPVFKEQARLHNPLLGELAAQKGVAHQGYKKEIGNYAPEIALFGQYEIYQSHLDIPTPEWVAGVNVNMMLFDGLARYNNVQAAKFRERRVGYMEKEARDKIDTLVDLNYQELMKAQEKYESLQTASRLSEEYLRIRKRAFAEGMGTSLEVVDAQLNASKVKMEKLQASYEYDIALARLLEASGQSHLYDEYRKKGNSEVKQ